MVRRRRGRAAMSRDVRSVLQVNRPDRGSPDYHGDDDPDDTGSNQTDWRDLEGQAAAG